LCGEYRYGGPQGQEFLDTGYDSYQDYITSPPAATRIESLAFPYSTGYATAQAQEGYSGPTGNYWPSGAGNADSVIWIGQIKFDYAEEYEFYASQDDSLAIEIGGVLVYWTSLYSNNSIPVGEPVCVQAGEWYDIVVLNADGGGPAHVRLRWSSPSVPLGDIPMDNFRTAAP